MNRTTLTVAVVCACSTAAHADVPPITVNFTNVTSTRVNMTVAEQSANEKEVDFGDIDNDGDLDVIVGSGSSDFGERRNKLYINNGGVFDEVSGTSIIPQFSNTDVTRNIFIRDYNNDGWLDFYLINDSNSGGYAGADHLFINQHPGGVFTGFVDNTSLLPSSGLLGAACGGVSLDLDQDGDIDVYSGNYPGPSQDVWVMNNSGASFSSATNMVPSDGDYTVDVASGDMNGDGKMDLLISNWDTNWIYYNDKNGEGSGIGDFRYGATGTDGKQSLGAGGSDENSMEAADFDNDGRVDFYWSNGSGGTGDLLYHNTGNNGSGQAQFNVLNNLPPKVNSQVSRKAAVADFNQDGRKDLFVMTQGGNRPVVLRNTSLPGAPSFVDWTAGLAFPPNSSLSGWHATVLDSNGDGDEDIFVGAFTGDHLFELVPATVLDEDTLVSFPPFFNRSAVAIAGRGLVGETDDYELPGVLTGFVVAIVNGKGDYLLELKNAGGTVVASSDRGALEIEEAFQQTTSTQAYTVSVTVLDCVRSTVDFDGDCNVGFTDLNEMLANWGPCPGGPCPWDTNTDGSVGFTDLNELLGKWGTTETEYLVEVLGALGLIDEPWRVEAGRDRTIPDRSGAAGLDARRGL